MLEKKLLREIYEDIKSIENKISMNQFYARDKGNYIALLYKSMEGFYKKEESTIFCLISKEEYNYARGFTVENGILTKEIGASYIGNYNKFSYFDKDSKHVIERIYGNSNDTLRNLAKSISIYKRRSEWEEIKEDMKLFEKKVPKDLKKYINTKINHFLFFKNVGSESVGKCSFCGHETKVKLKHKSEHTCSSCKKKLEAINYNIKKTHIINNYEICLFDKAEDKYIARYFYVTHRAKFDGSTTETNEYEREVFKNNNCTKYEIGYFSTVSSREWTKYKKKFFYYEPSFTDIFVYKPERYIKIDENLEYCFNHEKLKHINNLVYKMRLITRYSLSLKTALEKNYDFLIPDFMYFNICNCDIQYYMDNNYTDDMIEVSDMLTNHFSKLFNYKTNKKWLIKNSNWVCKCDKFKLLKYLENYSKVKSKKHIKISLCELISSFKPFILGTRKKGETSKALNSDNYFKYIPFDDMPLDKKVNNKYICLMNMAINNPNLLEMGIKFKAYNFLKSLNFNEYVKCDDIEKKTLINGIKRDYSIQDIEKLNYFIKNIEGNFNKACALLDTYANFNMYNLSTVEKTDDACYREAQKSIGQLKIIKYIAKNQSLSSIGTLCISYKDYIEMALELKVDLNNTGILFPKNLIDAHDKLVIEMKKIKMAKYDDKFFERTEKLLKYELEKGDYKVEVPKCYQELIEEGSDMGNCIAKYYKNIATTESDILFIRRKEETGEWVPFADIEIESKLNKLRQISLKSNKSIINEVKEKDSKLSQFIKELSEKHDLSF